MSLSAALDLLRAGEGVWLRGAPGSGRSHLLRAIAAAWVGPVVWLPPGEAAPWHTALPPAVLICIDDAPESIARAAWAGHPVLAAGARPGGGWRMLDIPPLQEDEGVRLFLQHAPAAGPPKVLHQLVQRLGGSPTAIVAAARRWPAERLEALLLDPSPGWPGLQAAYGALTEAERDTLALLSLLPGAARREGLCWCGMARGLHGLVSTGWVTVSTPGCYLLAPALAAAIQPWRQGDVDPYFTWFLRETRARAEAWDASGGSREWFCAGLWPSLWAHARETLPWFFVAWSLSGEDSEALLAALAETPGLPPVLAARCAARAHQSIGERARAVAVLQGALGAEDDPAQHALARLELGVAHHRLRDQAAASAAYADAQARLQALRLRRGQMLCWANMAALAHDSGAHDAARQGYLDAIAEATVLGELRLRGMFSGNLGALLLEVGALDEARAVLHQAARSLAEERDDRFLAIVKVNRAAVDLLEGHLDAADAHYQEALGLLRDADPASTALCHARRGAVAALRGALGTAREHHERADGGITPQQDPLTARLVLLWRVFLEWQAGDRASALARRRESLTGSPALVSTSDEARLVLRLLDRLVAQPGEVLLVGAQGAWFRCPGSAPVSVSKYAAVARILELLAQSAEASPGEMVDADALIEAGWPGERIVPDAARNRLSVELARLRKLGMRGLLQRGADGWRLDPDWPVLLLRDDAWEPPPEAAG